MKGSTKKKKKILLLLTKYAYWQSQKYIHVQYVKLHV